MLEMTVSLRECIRQRMEQPNKTQDYVSLPLYLMIGWRVKTLNTLDTELTLPRVPEYLFERRR